MSSIKADISAVLITQDEEARLGACLEKLSFCREIVVVDSGSRDKTAWVAKNAGARVFENPFRDFASQKNFAWNQASSEWVLSVDADESVNPELAAEITEAVSGRADGYWIRRTNRIFGRWMKHGAQAGDWQLRLARKQRAAWKGRVHERLQVEGRTEKLKSALAHESTATLADYMRKLNRYTSLEVQEMLSQGAGRGFGRTPLATFVRQYFVQQGFLDGHEGFLFAALSAYYEFVRRAKYQEFLKKGKRQK